MRRSEISELHYIAAFGNLESILRQGLLSHDRVQSLSHESIAADSVQQLRAGKTVAGRRLHSYVNLYLWARNPMLYQRFTAEGRRDICVLSIHASALELPGVVITDRNAATRMHRAEYVANGGLEFVDRATTFAHRWTHVDKLEYERRKAATQAEVLVPDRVPPRYIRGAYLPSRPACAALHAKVPALRMRPWPYLFFLGGVDRPGERYEPE